MKSNIKFTIIVPHYNSFDALNNLLGSIGIHDDIQIIVVDDHSDDFTYKAEVLKNQYPYVEIYQNKRSHNSAGTCRNIGLKHAKGLWLMFADADDYFEKDFYKIIEKYVNAQEDMILFTPTSINLTTNEISDAHLDYKRYIHEYLHNPSVEREMALRYKMEPPWSKMIKTEIIQCNDITFDNTLVGNDVMFSAKCGYYCKNILPVKDIIYCYTKGNHMLTRASKEKQFVRVNVFVCKYQYLKERLTERDFKALNFRAAPMIVNIIKDIRIFGIFFLIKIFMVFIKNRIAIVTQKDVLKLLNGFYIRKRMKG